jgi:hypothetical protein
MKTRSTDGYDGKADNLYEVRYNGETLAVEASARAALSHLPFDVSGWMIVQVIDSGERCEIPRWPMTHVHHLILGMRYDEETTTRGDLAA